MKNLWSLLLLLFPLAIIAQSEMETLPRLHTATLYLNSAKLDYTTTATLPAGHVKLIFKGLSPYLIKESVMLGGTGQAEIINMQFRNNFLINERDNERIRQLEKQWKDLRRQLTLIDARIQALQGEIKMLQENAKRDKAPLSQVQQYISYYKKRYIEVQQNIFELEQKKIPLAEKAKKLKKQIDELKGKANKKSKDLIVSLYVHKKQTFRFNLSYLTRNAYWRPSYTLKTDGHDKVNWNYQAEITQNTGIDWPGVRVALSSLRPQFRMQLPHPQPWYLNNIQRKRERYTARYKSQPVMEAAVVQADAAQVEYMEAETVESTIDVQYSLPTTYDVLSGGEPLLVSLRQFSTPATFRYLSVPYINRNAYLQAQIGGLDEHRLLPGKVRLYYDNRYTGQTYFNPQNIKDKWEIAFGTDPEIVVERKTVRNYKDYKSLSGKVVVQRAYTITVKNGKKMPIDIVIKDRIPVSQDEKIEVRNIRIDNGGHRDKNGIITWEKHLKPGEKITLNFSFEVKYPKDYTINL